MKKQFLKISLVTIMASIYSTGAISAAISGNASATVIAPIVLAETAAMNFGTISPGTASSTITVDTANGRTLASGDATLIGGAGATSGAFTIQGNSGTAFTLTLSVDAVLSDGAATPNTMTMLATSLTETGSALTLDGTAQAFAIGGTLTVPSGQVAGSYSTANTGGTPFTVTANYN